MSSVSLPDRIPSTRDTAAHEAIDVILMGTAFIIFFVMFLAYYSSFLNEESTIYPEWGPEAEARRRSRWDRSGRAQIIFVAHPVLTVSPSMHAQTQPQQMQPPLINNGNSANVLLTMESFEAKEQDSYSVHQAQSTPNNNITETPRTPEYPVLSGSDDEYFYGPSDDALS